MTTPEAEELAFITKYRRCAKCDIFLTEGFVIDGGCSYYCNDHEPADFQEMYAEDPDGDSYWTTWDAVK